MVDVLRCRHAVHSAGRGEQRRQGIERTPRQPPQNRAYSGFLLSGVQLHARTRSARLRESVSIWRALSAVLFPSGISGRPRRCRHGSAADCPEGETPQAPQPVGLTGERLPPKSSACAPQSAPFAMNCRGCTVTALKRLPRVCERLRVFCGVPSCRSCREERKPRRQALSRPHCLNPRAPRLCPQLHACEPVRSRGYVCIL